MKIKKITQAAKGRECTIQLHPYCNGNPETTVFAHINSERKGMGIKSPDYFGCFACGTCHDIIDGRMKTEISKEEKLECILRGLYRTWRTLIEEGLIKVG